MQKYIGKDGLFESLKHTIDEHFWEKKNIFEKNHF